MAKVSIKTKTGWNRAENFVFGVSMGSQNHKGEALIAIIEALNEGNFKHGVIDVSDTLNRFRYMAEGIDEKKAYKIALEEGENWIKENSVYFNRLKMPFIIKRWGEWLEHHTYNNYKTIYQNLYFDYQPLKIAIENDINTFCERNYGTSNISLSKKIMSRAYYLEELAVQTIIQEHFPSLVIYPGKQLQCFKVIRSGQIPEAPDALRNSDFCRLVIHTFERAPQVNRNKLKIISSAA